MKTKYILYPLLMALAILLPTSCSSEEDVMEIPTSKGEKVSFTIGVELAGASKAESRAFTEEKTDEFNSLHVAVFDVTEDGSYLKEFVEATPLTTQDNDQCWSLASSLPRQKPLKARITVCTSSQTIPA